MASVWDNIKAAERTLGDIKMISITRQEVSDYGCALLVSCRGEVYALGKNKNGCLALESDETQELMKIQELSSVSGVSVCDYYGDALAYTREGKVLVWGANVHGSTCRKPDLLQNLPNIIDAKCINGHYLALSDNGKVYEWRGIQTYDSVLNALNTTPTVVELSEPIVAITCGASHSLAVTKCGDIYSFGNVWSNEEVLHQPATKISLPGETVAKVLEAELGDKKLKLKVAKLKEGLTKLEENYTELQTESSKLQKLEKDHLKLKQKISEMKSAILQQAFEVPTDDSTNPESAYSEKAEVQKEGKGGVGNQETINFEITEGYKSKKEADGKPMRGQLDIKGTNKKTETYQSEINQGYYMAERDHLETEEISIKRKRII